MWGFEWEGTGRTQGEVQRQFPALGCAAQCRSTHISTSSGLSAGVCGLFHPRHPAAAGLFGANLGNHLRAPQAQRRRVFSPTCICCVFLADVEALQASQLLGGGHSHTAPNVIFYKHQNRQWGKKTQK